MIAATLVLLGAVSARAATIVEPGRPPTVVANASLTVAGEGFPPGKQVFVEQCDGVPPTAANWSPTLNCDLGTSPSPVIADAQGRATFAAGDVNHAFRPFEGESPQSLFNCMAAGHRAPANGLPAFTNCKLRVSTNNAAVTADQVFLSIVLSGRSVPPPTTVPPGSATNGHSTTVPLHPTTTRPGHSATTRAGRGATSGAATKSTTTTDAAGAAAPAVAVLHAGSRPSRGVGVLGLADAGLEVGYLLVLGGVLVAISPALRRRSRAPKAHCRAGDAPIANG